MQGSDRPAGRRWPFVLAVAAACLCLTAAAVLAFYGGYTKARQRMTQTDARHVVTVVNLHNAACAADERLSLTLPAEDLYRALGGEASLGLDRQRFERALPYVTEEDGGARFVEKDNPPPRSSHVS